MFTIKRLLGQRSKNELVKGAKRNIIKSELNFDSEFYLEKYPDVLAAKADPYSHYEEFGISQNRWPHPYFDPIYYRLRYSNELEGIIDLFSFFNKVGVHQGHIPIPYFAPRWYVREYKDIRQAGINPFVHFTQFGDLEGRRPSPYFYVSEQSSNYKSNSPTHHGEVRRRLMHRNDAAYYPPEIFKQLIADADLLEDSFYLRKYDDVLVSGGIPIEHFVLHGARELRSPNPVTDMRLIDLVVRASDTREKFYVYLQEQYDYELTREQNNYALWRSHFDGISTAHLNSPDKNMPANSKRKVLAVVAVTQNMVSAVAEIVSTIQRSKYHFVDVCVVFNKALAGQSVHNVSSRLRSDPGIAFAEEFNDFDVLLTGYDYVLYVADYVLIDPYAILTLVSEAEFQGVTYVYPDHDHLVDGHRQDPSFKPKFSPTYLNNCDYIGPVLLIDVRQVADGLKRSIWEAVNTQGPTSTRALLSGQSNIGHTPFILYQLVGEQTGQQKPEIAPVEFSRSASHSVSIIIPMRDKSEFTRACIESVLTYTNYPRDLLEIIIVNNGSIEDASIEYLGRIRSINNVKVVEFDGTFNFAKINNFAAEKSSGKVLIFLNNDTSLIDSDWVYKLVHHAVQPQVGVVGCKLVYGDGTVQHGGCVVGAAGGYVEHLLVGKPVNDTGAQDITREMSVMTGACIALEASKFWTVEGFRSVLKVAWNDVYLCLSCLELGLRNIYISDALLYHYESKSRGFDNSSEKQDIFVREAAFTRMRYKSYFFDDPSYNSNLSVESAGKLATPPRTLKPWLRIEGRHKRVLLLSCIYNVGYGVPVVMERHARKMVECGWEVYVGGPRGDNEIVFEDCTRVYLGGSVEAASFAYFNDISIIVSHTPPFFRITDYVGAHVAVICYDYGEPSPKLFDATTKMYLEDVNRQKFLAFSLSTKVVAISDAVKGEGKFLDTAVVGLGNDHLAVWVDTMIQSRQTLREKLGWQNKRVILNVCRFPRTERQYKGLDKYVDVMTQFEFSFSESADKCVWVLAGAAGPEDVLDMKATGLEVFANLPNEELACLYQAADVYMSFSKWEGYNLGVGQALAMGLPVAASDIEAHREFPIFTSNSSLSVARWLNDRLENFEKECLGRAATVFEWADSAFKFEKLMADVLQELGLRR